MADAGFSVQKAVYAALDAALSCSVYDHVPQGAAYPYVVIDSQLQVDADGIGARAEDRSVYLSIWSTYKGQKEVLDIVADIRAALHRTRPTLDSGTAVWMTVARATTQRDADGETFQGLVTVRVRTQP